jgi:Ala-tRNA(Pro) deacylase
MGISPRLKRMLDEADVFYQVIPHAEVFTTPEVAASIHAPGRMVAKVVLLRVDARHTMAVLPAHHHLDLARFSEAAHAERAVLASEPEIRDSFPDCEIGAMPPFGNLYGLETYLDEALAAEPKIFFQAGSHHEVIEMRYEDYERLVRPKVVRLAVEAAAKASGF